jgi:hypothetical protein
MPYMFSRPATGAPLSLREVHPDGAEWAQKYGHVVLSEREAGAIHDLYVRVQKGLLLGDTAPAPECDVRHGEFIRWLIATGKINEEV